MLTIFPLHTYSPHACACSSSSPTLFRPTTISARQNIPATLLSPTASLTDPFPLTYLALCASTTARCAATLASAASAARRDSSPARAAYKGGGHGKSESMHSRSTGQHEAIPACMQVAAVRTALAAPSALTTFAPPAPCSYPTAAHLAGQPLLTQLLLLRQQLEAALALVLGGAVHLHLAGVAP